MAALLAPLLSIATLSGTPLAFMAFSKNRKAAASSRLCGHQKVNRLTFLVHGPVEIFPNAFSFRISLDHPLAVAHRALVLAEHVLKQGQKPDGPAVDGEMINTNAALLHHFLKMAIAQRIGCVPADANQSHVDWESHSFSRQHRVQACSVKALSIDE